MRMGIMTVLMLVLFLLFVAGAILLQIFLAKRESKWPGLLLPLICFVYSLLMVLGYALFDDMSAWSVVLHVGSIFLLSNIPTALLLGIYFACREKSKRQRELEKMTIQDLE